MNKHLQTVKNTFNKQEYLNNSSYRIYVRKIIIKEMLKKHKITPQSILDIGCGDGSLSFQLLNKKSSLTLLDLSPHMIQLCKKTIIKNKIKNTKTILGNYNKAPKKKYDLIICIGLLAHVDNISNLLDIISDRLSKNAILIIETTKNPYPLKKYFNLYYYLKSFFIKDVNTYSKNHLSEKNLLRQLGSRNFVNISIKKFNIPLPGMRLWPKVLKNFYTYLTYKSPILSRYGSEAILLCKKNK